jgi:TIR domain
MKIFLSYAREDAEAARVIYERLQAAHHAIFNWRAPETEGERFIQATEEAIRNADYFFALLSPNYLASNWCREERNFALRCEHERAGTQFIHVLQVGQVNPRDAGYLGSYGWRDITEAGSVGPALDALLALMEPGLVLSATDGFQAAAVGGGQVPADQDARSSEVDFRNRQDELERVLRGLTNAAGPHFWLVLGPPRQGKTWFIDRIRKDPLLAVSSGWVIKWIDLREQPPELRVHADSLLNLMFGRPSSPVDEAALRGIAIDIIRSKQRHLYLLDSAELLDPETAVQLRAYLSPIYQRVLAGGRASSRLAVIVASRQHEGWRGLKPDPRLWDLPLSEFTVDVVQTALRDLGNGLNFDDEKYRRYANLAHGLTEGLPALLALCLRWVEDQAWTDLDRMAKPDTFREVAGTYIESDLLTTESLIPGHYNQGGDQVLALRHAYRLLAPYRLFTQSHLRHHLERDPDLTDILGRLGWSMTDLWQAISGTALLTRPPTEPWQRIQPAVRRLLYRYFYEVHAATADGSPGGAEAHREAARFIKEWVENQVGTEQVVGLVECLWHEANVLPAAHPETGAEELIASARHLSEDLRPSRAYTLEELREYAEKLMRDDDEFQRTVGGVEGLFDRIVEIVRNP